MLGRLLGMFRTRLFISLRISSLSAERLRSTSRMVLARFSISPRVAAPGSFERIGRGPSLVHSQGIDLFFQGCVGEHQILQLALSLLTFSFKARVSRELPWAWSADVVTVPTSPSARKSEPRTSWRR